MDSYIEGMGAGACVIDNGAWDRPEMGAGNNFRVGKALSNDYAVCYGSPEFLDAHLRASPDLHSSIPLCLMGRPELKSAGIASYQQIPSSDSRGGGVLLGFADTGIDYASPAFRWKDGSTRVRYIWDQSLPGGGGFEYKYGTEFSSEQINAALGSDDPYGVVNHVDESGHGTFLASVACSGEEGEHAGVAPDAELIVVKLKGACAYCRKSFLVPDYEENVFETADLIQAVDYLVNKAKELNKPIAICIGLGTNFAGHDGYNVMEEYLSGASNKNGVAIACAAGNEGSAGHHFRDQLLPGADEQRVDIMVENGCPSIMMSIWHYYGDVVSVSLESPGGEKVPRLGAKLGQTREWGLILEPSSVSVTYVFPSTGSIAQHTDVRIYDPSPGIWKLTLHRDLTLNGIYDIWLPNDGLGGENAHFVKPHPLYTVTMPGTSTGVIACCAYDPKTATLYTGNSVGPTRVDQYFKPEICAPGVDTEGLLPSGHGTMTGTSVAAAVTAGACALLLQWGLVNGNVPSMNTYFIKTLLIQGCDKDANVLYPDRHWGYGRINLLKTMLAMRWA